MNDDKYKNVSSKLSDYSIERLTRIAQKKGMSIYQLIQMVCDTIIRYMDDRHNLSEEIERAMSIFEHMVGWADALNLADPTAQKEVAQAVYIFQGLDNSKRGFRAVMVDKPWMGVWTQTANVMEIFERIFNICMPELYMKLYRARIILGCERVSEVINILADAEVIMQLNSEYRREFEDAARADNGRAVTYGARTKAKQHRTPDSLARDQRIKFDDYGRETAEDEMERSRHNTNDE
jgi:2-hydroxychromene-2-carboxylate isomerase